MKNIKIKLQLIIKNVLKKASAALKEAAHMLVEYLQQCRQERAQAVAQQQQAIIYNRLQQFFLKIQCELYVALQGNHYSWIAPIQAPNDIRQDTWTYKDGFVIFHYLLRAQRTGPVANTLLQIEKDHLNYNINYARQMLVANYGPMAMNIYPFLWNGIFVFTIDYVGIDIRIGVISLFPLF